VAKILVVDDVSENVTLLRFQLESEGYVVVEALNGQQAIEIAEQQSPDLVLLDVMMPGMTGLDVVRILKQAQQLNKIPIILVTANSDDESVVEGLDLGAYDYIIKPYNPTVMFARVRAALREKERQDLLERWATTDPLTDISNRRYFFSETEREFERAKRGSLMSLLLLDIDKFKLVNDQYGHIAGDQALINLANILKKSFRKVDIYGRFGGEEFIVCLPDTPLDASVDVAERLRKTIQEQPIGSDKGEFHISVSIGVTNFTSADKQLADMIKRADLALYRAKENGRNRVEVESPQAN
jgi:diguanylate cyclase (GGDEF)-like protein